MNSWKGNNFSSVKSSHVNPRLYLKVSDLYWNNPQPKVGPDDSIKKVIIEISSKRLGATAVIKNNKLVGIITDGDLRRAIAKYHEKLFSLQARNIMTTKVKTIKKDAKVIEAEEMATEKKGTAIRDFIKRNFRHFNAAVIVDAADAYINHLNKGGKVKGNNDFYLREIKFS